MLPCAINDGINTVDMAMKLVEDLCLEWMNMATYRLGGQVWMKMPEEHAIDQLSETTIANESALRHKMRGIIVCSIRFILSAENIVQQENAPTKNAQDCDVDTRISVVAIICEELLCGGVIARVPREV